MTKLALLTALLLPGCTIIGGVTGGMLAASKNNTNEVRRAHGENVFPDEDRSVGGSVIIGAGVGLLADIVVLSLLASALPEGPIFPSVYGAGYSD